MKDITIIGGGLIVLIGCMSGTGAKASLGYRLMAANLIMNKEEDSSIYQKTKFALGQQRLLDDIKSLSKDITVLIIKYI